MPSVTHDYACTYPQLINQAIAQGRSQAELARLRAAYDLAERLSDGVYRAQAVPFICHLVRAASVVLAEDQPVVVVQVAMLHGAYRLASFRDSRRRRTAACHRALIRRTLGDDVEQLLWTYDRLPWYSLAAVRSHVEQCDACDGPTRQALLVRLADYLDDHLDGAMAYAGRVYDDAGARAFCEACQQLARRLDRPHLAEQIAVAYANTFTVDLPDSVVMHRTRGYERPRCHLWEMTLLESGLLNLARWIHRRTARRRSAPDRTYGGVCETSEATGT